MAESPDDIVGHKTFRDGAGFRHEPLTRAEADKMLEAIEAAQAKRAAAFPAAEDCARGLWNAWYRLKELGWKDPRYAPPDGRRKLTVCIGSSGVLEAFCKRTGREDKASWWHPADDGDLYPHTPILYLPDAQEMEEDRIRGEKMRAAWAERRKGNTGGRSDA